MPPLSLSLLTDSSPAFELKQKMTTLAPEILEEIFKWTEPRDGPVAASQVCRRWRDAAIGDPALWCDIYVATRDAHDPSVLDALLTRSAHRKINLVLRFGDLVTLPPLPVEFVTLLDTVCPYLHRCRTLSIIARVARVWCLMGDIFHEEKYTALVALDLCHMRAEGTQPTDAPNYDDHLRPFTLPPNHPLKQLTLRDIELANEPPKTLADFRITHDIRNLRTWLDTTTPRLTLQRFLVPNNFPWALFPSNSITHLVLLRLRAPTRLSQVADSRPFFMGLQRHTPHLQTLEIEDWPCSRTWISFLVAVMGDARYLDLTDLRIRGMHFMGMGSPAIGRFLGAFPALMRLRLQSCSEAVLKVLQSDRTLCPRLKQVELNEGAVRLRYPFPT
ncbi:hypothetical protein DFH06DRAFT_447958 [Mycena polygramma]|nr:hypothetical protein DFH06DRAFT_447958 [Mycena polygramma]